MPNWLIILLVALAVVPGVAVILTGVVAMFFAPAAFDRRVREGEIQPPPDEKSAE